MSLRRLVPFALAAFVALPAAAQEADAPPADAPIESPDGETAEAIRRPPMKVPFLLPRSSIVASSPETAIRA